MAQCKCTNTRHGHGQSCAESATESDGCCKVCHDAVVNEEAAQNVSSPEDDATGFAH
jgi:hypothetical protein